MDFILRPWTEEDLDSLIKYGNNKEIAKFMTDKFPHPYTEEKGKGFIEFATSETPNRILAIDIEGEASGGIGIHPQDDIERMNAELGYWLAEPFWGKGIMTEALKRMVEYGFENFDVTRIFARPYGTNIVSQKALEKAGFKLEATLEGTFYKDGEYLDELIYAVRREK